MDDNLYMIFLLNVAWLATHELDAIAQHEWRVLPITSPLDDRRGYLVFTAAHIPLFMLIIWFSQDHAFQVGFDLFLMLHVALHWFFRNHPQYEFGNWFSQMLIWGGLPLGLLHLILILA
jgi:hypothetical protein